MGHRDKPKQARERATDILEKWRARGKEDHTAIAEEQDHDQQDDFLPLNLPLDRYDFDLAEFPLFRFYKNRLATREREPLVYTDTITGRDGEQVVREWKVYPSVFGFGGSSTQTLLYDLLQLYIEQGARERYIYFGTLRALFQRQGNRNPSRRDYERMRRDIDILRSCDFQGKNAFWDGKRRAYIDMHWRLFGTVCYAKEEPYGIVGELPSGALEVSDVLQQVARTRGFFALGFTSQFFRDLKPLEKRLALYLAKKFLSQKLHRRFVDDLAKALPIEAAQPFHVRMILKETAHGLLDKHFPLLASFALEQSPRDSRWLAAFHRKARPKFDAPLPRAAARALAPNLAFLVDRIVEATGDAKSRAWWEQCAQTLGHGGVDRALGQLRGACETQHVKRRGALLTKIFQDLACERGVTIH